jgi:hypothetical protein
MNLFTLVLVTISVVGLCVLGLAVGLILRNKCFSTCGCGEITYKGESLRCPACPNPKCERAGLSDPEA